MKQLSVVLGSYNRLRFLKLTIDSIRKELDQCPFRSEIIIVDGGSTDGTIKWLTKQKDIISIVQHNRGQWRGKAIERRSWGYFMNLGFRCAQGKYVCMLSDDCLVVPGAISAGVSLFEEKLIAGKKIGAVAFYWRNWPDQQEYYRFHFYGVLNVNHGIYLRQALIDVDYAEEETFQFYYGDVDLSFKLVQRGYEIISSENSYIEHYMHVNTKIREGNIAFDGQDGVNFIKKWSMIYGAERFVADNRAKVESKVFIDQNNTASLFPFLARYSRLRQLLRR